MQSPTAIMSWFAGRVFPRNSATPLEDAAEHVRAAIGAADLDMAPFPHVVVPDVLPERLYEEMLARWPARRNLPPEPGGLDRFMGHMIHPTRPVSFSRRYGGYWHDFSEHVGMALIGAALERFRRFNTRRFGPDADYLPNLVFFESGPNFEQHGAHTHHNHGPHWAMTFLLFMEDGGRTDRGETFSAPIEGADWLDVISCAPGLTPKPMKRIPFRPNTLLAWLDGPMSFHGTDMLPRDETRRRRILRCHVMIDEESAKRALGGCKPEGFFEATQAHVKGDSAALKQILARPSCVDAIPRFDFAD